MNTIQVNDKSFKEGLSISAAVMFALQAGGIGWLAVQACDLIELPNAVQFLAPCAVILYFFYALATMTKAQLKANAKANLQALESELQALKEKEQALSLDKHMLERDKRTLTEKLSNAEQVCTTALLDLASAKTALEQAHKAHERAIENASTLHSKALERLEARAIYAENRLSIVLEALGAKAAMMSASAKASASAKDEVAKANALEERAIAEQAYNELKQAHAWLLEVPTIK